MAGRPRRQTVDWFSHDADALHRSDTLRIIDGNYGNDGYALWFKLLERISRSDNCIFDTRNSNTWQLFLLDIHLSDERAKQILDHLARLDAIDPALWQARIIWCQKLVDRVAYVFKSREGGIVPQRPIHLIDNSISPLDNGISPADKAISGGGFTGSKENRTKENGSEEKETRVLPEGIDAGLWFDFLEMRKTKRLLPTARALKLLLRTLEKLQAAGDDPNAVIEQSIMCGWTGLFPLKLREKSEKPIPGGTPAPDKYLKQRYGHMVQR